MAHMQADIERMQHEFDNMRFDDRDGSRTAP
jgi:hypothetical protein